LWHKTGRRKTLHRKCGSRNPHKKVSWRLEEEETTNIKQKISQQREGRFQRKERGNRNRSYPRRGSRYTKINKQSLHPVQNAKINKATKAAGGESHNGHQFSAAL